LPTIFLFKKTTQQQPRWKCLRKMSILKSKEIQMNIGQDGFIFDPWHRVHSFPLNTRSCRNLVHTHVCIKESYMCSCAIQQM
jgi:hypothetical protein